MTARIGCPECAWGKVAGCWRCGSRIAAAARTVRRHAPYWLGAAVVCLLLSTWPEPEAPTAATRDAQATAAQRARWLQRSVEQCREAYGADAIARESADGDLICRAQRRPAPAPLA